MTSPGRTGDGVITVLIPTFNRREQLQKAVESVLQESRVPIRLKIFDNASSDATSTYAVALAASDSRVSYCRRPENIGAVSNFIDALGTVDTEFFVPLADDDWVLPQFLCDAHALLVAHGEACAAIFVTEGRDEAGGLVCRYPDRTANLGLVQPDAHLRELMTNGHYGWSSILWRREVLELIGAPYFHVGLPSDVDMQLQIFSQRPAFIVDRPGAVYLMHPGQNSQNFGLAHAGSWARMFLRLDRTVLRQKILSTAEYLALRQRMVERYRGLWTAQPKAPLSHRRAVHTAWLTGLRLGDWETAFEVLEHATDHEDAVREADEVITWPSAVDTGFGAATTEVRPPGLRTVLRSLAAWMAQNLRTQRAQFEQVAQLNRELACQSGAAEHLRLQLAQQVSENQQLKERCVDAERHAHLMHTKAEALERALAIEKAEGAVLMHQLGEAQLLSSMRYIPRRLFAKITGRPISVRRSR